jgi:hypothetical protein
LIGKSLEVAKKIAYKTTNYVHFCDLRNSAHIKKKKNKKCNLGRIFGEEI